MSHPDETSTDASIPRRTRRELTRRLRFACASAYGIGAGMTGNELIAYVIEHGLPSSTERERIQAERDELEERLSREQDTTNP